MLALAHNASSATGATRNPYIPVAARHRA